MVTLWTCAEADLGIEAFITRLKPTGPKDILVLWPLHANVPTELHCVGGGCRGWNGPEPEIYPTSALIL